ncbi:dihydrofolate reductase family protein [Actinokineospora guangxiensis]|uniref:Dihydrofolate reductase family protein n=1 Tax=Actinokineospora guangxiensis TaxID=1490288 RepID=A0ABW0EGN9_9PSEU
MRTFKLQVQVTADGFMGGPSGEMDWMTLSWSDDLNAYIEALTSGVDTIVLGRGLAEGFIPAWESRPAHEDDASVDFMINTPKVVVSRTLAESPWENAVVVADPAAAVAELKARPGGDLIAYGGSSLVRSLIAGGLLDELHLVVNPVSIGRGLPVFPEDGYQRLALTGATRFDCGMAVLKYERPE